MDVLRVDKITFLPDLLIEGYTSMIWTERYLGNGEFELVTGAVFETLDILPQGSLLTVRDSSEVMIVETRFISVDADGIMSLKISGRSFETFLENRVMVSTKYGEQWKVLQPYTASVMACMLIWNYIVNPTLEDPMKPTGGFIDELLAIAGVVVTDSTTYVDTAKKWWVESGSVYPVLQDFLALRGFGVRTIRPNKTTGTVVSFSTATTAARGTVTKTVTNNIPQLRVDVYHGKDRSHLQSTNPAIIFHYDSGHIDNPSYLFSIKDYKNMVVATSSIGTQEVWKENATSGDKQAAGLNRRAMYMDGGTKNTDDTTVEFQESITQKGQVELQKFPRVRIYDGQISPTSPFVYQRDYFLGDLVTVMARFGFIEVMFVNEYIRTEDADGDRGYPGLLST